MKYGKVTNKVLEFIRSIVGSERMSVGESVLDLHSKDESFHQKHKPELVVWPLSADEISQILNLADEKMKEIKRLLDPNGIMNPGGIFN